MAAITPNGTIRLLKKVPLNPNYAHSIAFSSISEQDSYMEDSGKVVLTLTDQNYVKTDNGKIRIKINPDSDKIEDASYMMWKNPSVGENSAQKCYAFITNVDVVSANVVEITYKIDVLQTFVIRNRITFKECYIERSHTASDTVGGNLAPEPVSFSDKVYQTTEDFGIPNGYSNFRIIMWATFYIGDIAHAPNVPAIFDGMKQGCMQGLCATVFRNFDAFKNLMNQIGSWSEEKYNFIVNNIVAIIAVPAAFAPMEDESLNFDELADGGLHSITQTFTKKQSGSLDGYSDVKNNKLYTYPFNNFYLTNNDGGIQEYRYEYFDSDMTFIASAAVQPNFEIVVYPMNYAGAGGSGDKALSLSGYPQVPWVSSAYKQWLGTSKMSYDMQAATMGVGALLAGAAGQPILASSMASQVLGMAFNYNREQNQAKQLPNNAHSGSSSAKTVANLKKVTGYQYCINKRDARRIDDFFTEFGYARGIIGTPSISNGRKNQHYIKTSGCMVLGECPAEYCREIENIFNTGVTWWKNGHIGDYN